jgi:hypothetical protein
VSKKSNVHPDHYKTAGRDRPDDAARARLNRAIAAKAASQQHPDRMAKGFYFERPEAGEGPERAGVAVPRAAKKTPARKASAARRPAALRKAASSKRGAKPVARKK